MRTWIQPSMRESIDVALRDLIPQARVQHVVRGEELYVAFPYRSRAILVCSVPNPDYLPDGDERRSLPLIDLLSGWDGSLLLCSEAADELRGGAIDAILASRLAPRLGVLSHGQLLNAEFAALLQRELRRVLASASVLPPSRLAIPPEWLAGISRLAPKWQGVIHAALGNRDDWPAKRVCAVLRIDRSTLDRGFRKQGIPTLSAMLRRHRA